MSFFLATPSAGTVNLVGLSFVSDADLMSQQGDPLTLLTLTFIGLAEGTSSLTFGPIHGLAGVIDPDTLDASNLLALGATFGSASATIVATAVPEPATVALFAFGLALLAFRRQPFH